MKKSKAPEGWEYVKNLPEKTLFRYNEKTDTQWRLIKRKGEYWAQQEDGPQTRRIDRNKLVYLEY